MPQHTTVCVDFIYIDPSPVYIRHFYFDGKIIKEFGKAYA